MLSALSNDSAVGLHCFSFASPIISSAKVFNSSKLEFNSSVPEFSFSALEFDSTVPEFNKIGLKWREKGIREPVFVTKRR